MLGSDIEEKLFQPAGKTQPSGGQPIIKSVARKNYYETQKNKCHIPIEVIRKNLINEIFF